MPYQIAIDGPASSGKSSVGRLVAEALGFCMLDTGLLYRAVAWGALRSGSPDLTPERAAELARRTPAVSFREREAVIVVDGADITPELSRPDVSRLTARLAQYQPVRALLVERFREVAGERDIVMVGRDIGSVVLPEASLKVFLEATSEERARRRHREYEARGMVQSYESVLADLLERDDTDATRTHAPLARAPDAEIIDTTRMTLPQVVELVVGMARRRFGFPDKGRERAEG